MKDITDIVSFEQKPGLLSYWREKTGRINLFRYADGIYKYKAFPPKRGFSEYDKSMLEALVFHSSIIGDSTLNSSFSSLKRIFITPKVSSISEHSFGNLDLDLLEFDSVDTYFSPNALSSLSTLTLIYDGNKYTNIDPFKKQKRGNRLTAIRKDDDNRLNFEIGETLSLGQVDNYEKTNSSVSLEEYSKRTEYRAISDLLENSTINNTQSIFFYTKTKETSYGAQAVIDSFPLSDMRLSNPPDDKLVAIYVNGVNELDLNTLSKYPNIKQVFVSPTVKTVYGEVDKSKTVSYSDHTSTWSEWQNSKGNPVKVVCISKDTLILPSRVPKGNPPGDEKDLGNTSKEIEI